MSCEASSWAFACSGISPAAKLVLLTFANVADPAGCSAPSRRYLAQGALLEADAIERRLRELEAAGLIERIASTRNCDNGGFESVRLLMGRKPVGARS